MFKVAERYSAKIEAALARHEGERAEDDVPARANASVPTTTPLTKPDRMVAPDSKSAAPDACRALQ